MKTIKTTFLVVITLVVMLFGALALIGFYDAAVEINTYGIDGAYERMEKRDGR